MQGVQSNPPFHNPPPKKKNFFPPNPLSIYNLFYYHLGPHINVTSSGFNVTVTGMVCMQLVNLIWQDHIKFFSSHLVCNLAFFQSPKTFMNANISFLRSFPASGTYEKEVQLTDGRRTIMETLHCIYAGRTVTYSLHFIAEDCQSNVVQDSIQCKYMRINALHPRLASYILALYTILCIPTYFGSLEFNITLAVSQGLFSLPGGRYTTQVTAQLRMR